MDGWMDGWIHRQTESVRRVGKLAVKMVGRYVYGRMNC